MIENQTEDLQITLVENLENTPPPKIQKVLTIPLIKEITEIPPDTTIELHQSTDTVVNMKTENTTIRTVGNTNTTMIKTQDIADREQIHRDKNNSHRKPQKT